MDPVASKAPVKIVRVAVWACVSAAGAVSVAILALSRGEPVSALWMVVAAACVFAVAYRFHSAWLMAKVLTIDPARATPAEVHCRRQGLREDEPLGGLRPPFRGDRRAGPLVGPVLAAQFGYLPGSSGY
jgi:carbon starvation protein